MTEHKKIVVAVDGSCFKNPGGATGWAWVSEDGKSSVGGQPEGTNQIGELKAVIQALSAFPTEELEIQIDSEYAMNVATGWAKGWRRRGWQTASGSPVQNLALVKVILFLMETRTAPVTFIKVPGHDPEHRFPLNDKADALAKAAAARSKASGAFQE